MTTVSPALAKSRSVVADTGMLGHSLSFCEWLEVEQWRIGFGRESTMAQAGDSCPGDSACAPEKTTYRLIAY